MDLSSLLSTTLKPQLVSMFPGWTISTDEIKWPTDKLLEVLVTDVTFEYVDFDTPVFRGIIAFVLYKEYNTDYLAQLDATETLLEWLPGLSSSTLMVGDESPTLANVRTEYTSDGQHSFRVMTASVPFQLTNS